MARLSGVRACVRAYVMVDEEIALRWHTLCGTMCNRWNLEQSLGSVHSAIQSPPPL